MSSELQQVLQALAGLQADNKDLKNSVSALSDRVDKMSGVQSIKNALPKTELKDDGSDSAVPPIFKTSYGVEPVEPASTEAVPQDSAKERKGSLYSSRIILTTYPGQSGIDPVPLSWGESDPQKRGPVVVGRGQSTVRRRNGMCILFLSFLFLK